MNGCIGFTTNNNIAFSLVQCALILLKLLLASCLLILDVFTQLLESFVLKTVSDELLFAGNLSRVYILVDENCDTFVNDIG